MKKEEKKEAIIFVPVGTSLLTNFGKNEAPKNVERYIEVQKEHFC